MTWDVVHEQDGAPGWAPIDHLSVLAARLLGGQRFALPEGAISRLGRMTSLGRRRARGDRALLAILRTPASLYYLRRWPPFRDRYGHVAVWIIDGFWHELIPTGAVFRDLDLVAVTRPNDEDRYRRIVGDRAMVLEWGADVLGRGAAATTRPVDVLRAGRQPPDWDDDAASARACAAQGLTFAGRPPFVADPLANQQAIMEAYARAKFVLAHSSRVSPGPMTHPTEEYMTARWTDTLAAGGVVAGVQPVTDRSMGTLLWPGAVLPFDRIDLVHNVAALAEAARGWTPETAAQNHRQALARLDWRHRLAALTRRAGIPAPALDADLTAMAAGVQSG